MMDKIIRGIREATKYSSCSTARIFEASKAEAVSIQSAWSQPDVDREETTKFSRTHIVDTNSSKVSFTSGSTLVSTSEKLSVWSPSGRLRSVLTSSKKDETEEFYIEIWNKSRRIKQWNLSSKELHGPVHSDVEFGCLSWSPDEKQLVYVAEKKCPKPKSLFSQKPSKDDEKPSLNEAFTYRESWGEQMTKQFHPLVCVVSVESGEVKILEQIPDNFSCGQVEFVDNDRVVGVAWNEDPYRLGLIYCANRKSELFLASTDGKYDKLSEENRSVASPRVCPDKSCIVYLDQKEGGPHKGTARLMMYHLEKKQNFVLVDVVDKWDGQGFAGLYVDSLPLRCWAGDKTLLLTSIRGHQLVSYIVCINDPSTSASLYELPSTKNLRILDTCCGIVLGCCSDVRTPDYLVVTRIPETLSEAATQKVDWLALDDPEEQVPSWMKNVTVDIMTLPSETGLKYNSIVLIPEGKTEDIPWILFPHGGPHSATTIQFSWNNAVLLYMGFGIVMVNYVGSTGQGQKGIDALIGNIGKTDVKDVHDAGEAAMKKYAQLSKEKKVLSGGSHGGFLVAHLMSQYSTEYKACAMRNPVIDIVLNTGISDIPDWNYEEPGLKFEYGRFPSVDSMTQMWKCSPYSLTESVQTPTLLLVGSEDMRVPMAQSINYYRMLKARSVDVSLRMYPDCHSLAKMNVNPDVLASKITWFLDHI